MLGVSSWPLLGLADRVGYPPITGTPLASSLSLLGGIDPSGKYFITQTAVLTCIVPVLRNGEAEKKRQPLQIISVTNRLHFYPASTISTLPSTCFSAIDDYSSGTRFPFAPEFPPLDQCFSSKFHPREGSTPLSSSRERCRSFENDKREHLLGNVTLTRR